MKTVNENFIGGEVKALGNGKLGGYLVRFTTEAQPDLQGDYFTKDTELGTFTDLPVLYHHGADKTIGKRVIGRGTIKQDAIGLWVEAQLAMRDEYEKEIYALAEKGALGWSSGAVSHLVEREYKSEKIAWVKTWWIAEASLTPTPAEAQNEAITIKGNVIAMPEEAQPVSAMQIQTISDDTETLEETKKTMEANDVTELKAQIAALTSALCGEIRAEPGDVALAWLVQQPGVTAPIIGPRTLAQLDAALRAVELELSADVLARLSVIFPGYKTSPEDFAW